MEQMPKFIVLENIQDSSFIDLWFLINFCVEHTYESTFLLFFLYYAEI